MQIDDFFTRVHLNNDSSGYTVFHRKMSHILDLFKVEDKIMNIMVVGVFIVLNGVTRG